jgi:hypothetical protein
MLRFLPLAAFVTVWQNDDMKPYVNTTIASSPALRTQAELGRLRTHTYSFPALESLTANLYGPDHFYNRLLTSAAFWRQPQTDWVLIFQSDTVVCRAAPLDLLLRYPYLGGPSGFVGSDAWVARRSPLGMDSPELKHDVNLPEEPRSGFAPVDMHMNGGLSIHNVTWSLGCIERYHDAFKFVEDDLWNHCRAEQGVQVVERDMYAFASDNGLTGCFSAPPATGGTGASQRVCPWGLHKPWNRARSVQALAEMERSCPGLDSLKSQQQIVACYDGYEYTYLHSRFPLTQLVFIVLLAVGATACFVWDARRRRHNHAHAWGRKGRAVQRNEPVESEMEGEEETAADSFVERQ